MEVYNKKLKLYLEPSGLYTSLLPFLHVKRQKILHKGLLFYWLLLLVISALFCSVANFPPCIFQNQSAPLGRGHQEEKLKFKKMESLYILKFMQSGVYYCYYYYIIASIFASSKSKKRIKKEGFKHQYGSMKSGAETMIHDAYVSARNYSEPIL